MEAFESRGHESNPHMIFMKLPFTIKKVFVYSVKLKHPKFVHGAECVTLVIIKLAKRTIDFV
jgi:hypothetical protein